MVCCCFRHSTDGLTQSDVRLAPQSLFMGNFALYNFSQGRESGYSAPGGPVYINESVYLFAPGDCIVLQYIELSADGSTPTGRRAFSQNITIVRNETEPITTTLEWNEQGPGGRRTETRTQSVFTTSRPPPNPTFPWTAEVLPVTTTTGAGASGSSGTGASGTAVTTPANTAGRSKTISKFWQ